MNKKSQGRKLKNSKSKMNLIEKLLKISATESSKDSLMTKPSSSDLNSTSEQNSQYVVPPWIHFT